MQNYLELPNSNLHITPGCQVKLGRFDTTIWSVAYGWYTWGGNRSVCGWYLYNTHLSEIKPLQETDLDDIYLIESPSYPYLDNCKPCPNLHTNLQLKTELKGLNLNTLLRLLVLTA